MPPEQAIKCESCKNEELVHGLRLGRLNGMLMVGGPGQDPQTMGNQWAVYFCPACRSVWPYNRHYPGTRALQDEYAALYARCKEWNNTTDDLSELKDQLEGIINANQTLASLPGGQNSFESVLSTALTPILERLDALEQEARRKRGGRPKQCKVPGCREKAVIQGLCVTHGEANG